jgi:hypothetical protein
MYPRWKHHAEHGAKLVQSKEHEESLGEGWSDDSAVWRPHLLKKDVEVEIHEQLAQVPNEDQKPKRGRKNAAEKISQ